MLITLTTCKRSLDINKELKMSEEGSSILHVAISDIGCDRLETPGLMIPITTPATGLIQLAADFK